MSELPSQRELTLSIVTPVYNERSHIAATLQAAATAIAASPFEAEFIIVDDGSTDHTAEVAVAAQRNIPVRVVRQPNRGRVPARRAGLAAVTGRYVLSLDSRVILAPGSLRFVAERLQRGECVWNGHVLIDTQRNPYGRFWNVLTELAWAEYFKRPRTTSFGIDDFESFPKGTTCFFASAELLRDACGQIRSHYRDERNAADDTPMIRWISRQSRIHISPQFSCSYKPRTSLKAFVRHAYHRGISFFDGHGRPDSRLFPATVAFYPASLLVLALSIKQPLVAFAVVPAAVAASGCVAILRGREWAEVVSFAALTPVYGVAHGAGMWRGLGLMLANWRNPAVRQGGSG
jgi:glycosyltransferase involved in cell wall biosynthesis